MAHPNHVQDDSLHAQHSQNLYVDPEFNGMFPGGVDQSVYNPYNRAVQPSLPQTWQSSTVSCPPSALGTAYENNNQFYNRPFSNSPLPYQDPAFRHGDINSYSQQPAVDPSLVSSSALQQPSYDMGLRTMMPANASPSTIAPQALQNSIPKVSTDTQSSPLNGQKVAPSVHRQATKATANSYGYQQTAQQATTPAPAAPPVVTPKGESQGRFMVMKFDDLVKATNSTRLHKYVTLGDVAHELSLNKTTIPNYTPRKSRREIKMLAASDKKLLSTFDRVERARILGKANPSTAKITKKSGKKASSVLRAPRIRTEPSSAQSPSSLKREYSDSGSETESSDESDYSSDEEDAEPSPLPASRPEEPKQAVRYDVIKATWLPSKTSARGDQIRVALAEYWEVVRTIRDRWRMDNKAVKEAELKNRVNELSLLKSRVVSQRAMMEVALRTTLELSHPDIVYHLGENIHFLVLLYQFLADRVTSQDYNDVVVGICLEVLARCSTLTNSKVEESKLSKAFNILSRKGNDKTKDLVKQILAKVAASPEIKAESPAQKSGESKANTKAAQPAARTSTEPPTASKRPRTADGAASEPAKRVASSLSTKPGTSAAAKPANGLKRPGEKPTAPANAAPKPKVNPVVAKPLNVFSSLQPALKKTGVQPAGKAGAPVKPATDVSKTTKAALAAPMRSSTPAFSFAETMANLMKPKEPEVVPKPEAKRPTETPEEKTKRLRKESRRHLRVAFRPDATLVSVRYFSHDPEEEAGHDPSMVRDAGDVGGEGRMFKQHKDQVDMDDEDDDLPREESYRDWVEPSLIDFSVIDIKERKKNYTKYGGGMAIPMCPEKEANERHEANTLMVFYTDKSDIPPSPREPLETSEEPPAKPVVEFGAPPADVLMRSAALAPPPTQPPVQDLAAIFTMMAQPPAQQQHAASTSQLESIFAQFSKPAQSTPAPPQAPTDLFSILGALQQPQGQPQAPVMPQYPTFTAPPVQAAPNPDVNALLAALYTQPNATAAPQLPFAMPNFNFATMAQQTQQQQSAAGIYENEERKRWRESGGGGAKREREPSPPPPQREHTGSFKKQKNKGNKQRGGVPHKVYPCRFFQEGKCAKGDACTYIHDRSEAGKLR